MPRRVALVVGIGQYESSTELNQLSSPVIDAQSICDVLGDYGDIEIIPCPFNRNKDGEFYIDQSGYVSADELKKSISEVLAAQSVDEIDLAIFYFSGHAILQDEQVVWLAASDKPTAIAFSWLAEQIENSAVQNVCLWLDCCHSGEIFKHIDLKDKGFCVIAASHAQGESIGIRDERSLMTDLLYEALIPGSENGREIRVLDLVKSIETQHKQLKLPQQILTHHGKTSFILTRLDGEVNIDSEYPEGYPPYKGLLTFTDKDQDFFFGRDGMIQQLLDGLNNRRFVPVLGASGSGKSSLVLAGLLPALDKADWLVLKMRPTADPLGRLRDAFRDMQIQQSSDKNIQVSIPASADDIQREVEQLTKDGRRLLLVLDQFEEVFTAISSEDEEKRATFFRCLVEALQQTSALHVVVTLRSDFLSACDEYPFLSKHFQDNFRLGNLDAVGLREAISRPLDLVGMRCEQALEDELVSQTLQEKGSLPLLQFVLEKLWELAREERSWELTLAMYQQLGGDHGDGLRGVLNEKADAFYQGLDAEQQRLMGWLMVELTQVGEGQEDTRRVVVLQELYERQPDYREALDELIALVTKERLLVSDQREDGEATVAVAHEALIRDWDRVAEWLEGNREIRRWRSRVAADIEDWQKTGGSLLRDGRLSEADEALARYNYSLLIGQEEQRFIVSSLESQKQELKASKQKQHELEVALQEAKRQTYIALSEKLSMQSELAFRSPSIANGHIEQGLLLATQAFLFNRQAVSAQAALHNSIQKLGNLRKISYGYVSDVAFSPDGKFVVSANIGGRGTLNLWDSNTGLAIGKSWQDHLEGDNYAVAFSPNGKFVVSGNTNNSIQLWDVSTGKAIGEAWGGHNDVVSAIAFSPNGEIVVSGSLDGSLRLWDVSTGLVIKRHVLLRAWGSLTGHAIGEALHGHAKAVHAVAFSPDGKFVVSGSEDKTLRLWNATTGQAVGTPWLGHERRVTSVAFNRNSKHVVSGSFDKTIRLWDVATGQAIGKPWVGHENGVHAVAISPDNKYVISGGGDKTLRLWKMGTGQPVGEPWHGHRDAVIALDISKDGCFVVSSGRNDKSIRFWSLSTTLTHQSLKCPQIFMEEVTAFSPSGEYVVTGSYDENLCVYSSMNGRTISKPNYKYNNVLTAIVFSSDSKHVLNGYRDGKLLLWNIDTGQIIGETWTGSEDPIKTVAFSLDGRFVVSGGERGLLFWDVATGQISDKKNLHISGVEAVDFSPDGKHIISGCYDNTLRLWDFTTGERIGEGWYGHTQAISALSYSPDGLYVISGSHDGTLRLWDTNTGRAIGDPWYGHEGFITAVIFSPDGKKIFSGSDDETLRIWDASPESWAKKACNIVNRNFSHAEWQRFIGDALPYQKTCPDHPAPGDPDWVEPYTGS